ncbi:MAG: hypothetical protein WCQ54_12095 [Clostridiaceae bacterium]
MREFIHDLLYALKLSLYLFAASLGLGLIIGLIKCGLNLINILEIAVKTPQVVSIIGFAISGLSFISRDTLRPLDYEKEWKTYFSRFNLAFSIFFISLFNALLAYILEYILFFKILV